MFIDDDKPVATLCNLKRMSSEKFEELRKNGSRDVLMFHLEREPREVFCLGERWLCLHLHLLSGDPSVSQQLGFLDVGGIEILHGQEGPSVRFLSPDSVRSVMRLLEAVDLEKDMGSFEAEVGGQTVSYEGSCRRYVPRTELAVMQQALKRALEANSGICTWKTLVWERSSR